MKFLVDRTIVLDLRAALRFCHLLTLESAFDFRVNSFLFQIELLSLQFHLDVSDAIDPSLSIV